MRCLHILILVFNLTVGHDKEISCPVDEEIEISRRTIGAPEGLGDEYKYLVMTISTYKNATDFRTARCTGTIVRPSIILTAGHCVDAIPEYNEIIVDVSVYSVSCSKSFISRCSQSQVYGFVYYRHLARKNANFDIALLFIESNLQTPKQLPFCEFQQVAVQPLQNIYISSFNTTDVKNGKLILTELPLRVRRRPKNEDKWFLFNVLSENPPTGTCFGDSGSPVFLKTINGNFCVFAVFARGCGGMKIEGITASQIVKAPSLFEYPQLLALIHNERFPSSAEISEWKRLYGLDPHKFSPSMVENGRNVEDSNYVGSDGRRTKCFDALKNQLKTEKHCDAKEICVLK